MSLFIFIFIQFYLKSESRKSKYNRGIYSSCFINKKGNIPAIPDQDKVSFSFREIHNHNTSTTSVLHELKTSFCKGSFQIFSIADRRQLMYPLSSYKASDHYVFSAKTDRYLFIAKSVDLWLVALLSSALTKSCCGFATGKPGLPTRHKVQVSLRLAQSRRAQLTPLLLTSRILVNILVSS